MKVLTIKKPYPDLMNVKKTIIINNFKTDYRGELYIYASSKVFKQSKENNELIKSLSNISLNQGYIFCKCNLVDCIYITEEFISKIKKNNLNEYICGNYESSKYAWILDDITKIKPIKTKGQTNIWNHYNEKEIMNLMESINYGWLDKYAKIHVDDFESFSTDYILQSPKMVKTNKIGVCWDQVELERNYFKSSIFDIKTYFIVHYDNNNCPTHTFLTYKKNNKYYWFEHSWEKFKGIHEYNSLKNLLIDVKNKFIKYELNNIYTNNNLVLYEYKKPKYNISVQKFFKHCESSKKILLDLL